MVAQWRLLPILIWFTLSPRQGINQRMSRLKKITYKDFFDPKWFAAHNMLSKILKQHIPFPVLECQYELGSDELKKGIKEYMKKHPNFPQCD